MKYGGSVCHGYRVVEEGNFRCLERMNEDGSAQRVMLYQDAAILPVDLIPLNFYVSGRPGSGFRNILNVNLRLEDGNVWISGRKFCRHTSEGNTDRELRDQQDLREVLEQHFGIPASDLPLRDLEGQPGF